MIKTFQTNVPESAMFDSSQPVQTAMSASSGLQLALGHRCVEPDDVAFGCECADPALQIACWGQEAEPSHAGSAS